MNKNIMKTLQALVLLSIMLAMIALLVWPPRAIHAQPRATINSIDDITGDGAAHALPASVYGRWVQIIPLRANGAAVRIGGSNVSASNGSEVAPGGGLKLQGPESGVSYWSPSTIYYYAANGDKISVTWGN